MSPPRRNILGVHYRQYYRKIKRIARPTSEVISSTVQPGVLQGNTEHVDEDSYIDDVDIQLSDADDITQLNQITAKTENKFGLHLLSIADQHKLSDKCIEALLSLLNEIGTENPAHKVVNNISELEKEIGLHYMDVTCYAKCKMCKQTKSHQLFKQPFNNMICCGLTPTTNDDHYIIFPIKKLLQLILPIVNKTRYTSTTESVDLGNCERALQLKNLLMCTDNDFTLTLNTDGATAFKSRRASFWPILAFVNEQSAVQRKHNVIMLGLFFGKSKPDFAEYLEPVIEQLLALSANGIKWQTYENEVIHSRINVLCVMCDSIARPLVQMTYQFNGTYGCPYCYYKGSKPHYYPMDNQTQQPRSHSLHLIDIENLENGKENRGVKGRTPFLKLPHFDSIKGFPPDIMHAVYLGIVKQLTEAWLTEKTNEKRQPLSYYLPVTKVSAVNTMLTNIRPPKRVSRTPRSLQYHAVWKAHEWSMWVHYYSTIVLDKILPLEYYKHWLLLVKGVSLLTSRHVSNENMEMSNQYLTTFVSQLPTLYSAKNCTFNSHLLLHLPEFARYYGPLHFLSLSVFENFNHLINTYLKSSQYVSSQIAKRYLRHILLKYRKEEKGSSVNSNKDFNVDNFTLRDHVVIEKHELCELELLMFQNANIEFEDATFFARAISLNNIPFHSDNYKRDTKRNSKCALLENGMCIEVKFYLFHKKMGKGYAFGMLHELSPCTQMVNHISVSSNNYVGLASLTDIKEVLMKVNTEGAIHFVQFLNSVENVNE